MDRRKVVGSRSDYKMKKMARLIAGQDRVLDLGWAEVPNPYLQNSEVIGLDRDQKTPPPNYSQTLVGDVMDLPQPFGPESFDAVSAGSIIEHLERPIDFLRQIRQTLKPGGLLVLSTPNPHYPLESLLTITLNRRYYYTPEHIYLFPQRWLVRMFEWAGFQNVRLFSGGLAIPFYKFIPFPRPWAYETIALGVKGT